MRIATYNIWNSEVNYNLRMKQLEELLMNEDLDLLALQEVRDEKCVTRIAEMCGYKSYYWRKYSDCLEGLAILSKYELTSKWVSWDITEDKYNSGMMYVELSVEGVSISILNIHLDYEKASNREKAIINGLQKIEQPNTDYKIILGDFNTSENSSVYRLITGCQSLNGYDTWWVDLVDVYCKLHGESVDPTLDFVDNPRWKGQNILEVPERFDMIFLKYPHPKANPEIIVYKLLGKIHNNGIVPSDHYGVLIELGFNKN